MFARCHLICAVLGAVAVLAGGCASPKALPKSALQGASLRLDIQGVTPPMSGAWSAKLARETVDGQVWFLTTVKVDEKSTSFPITLPVRSFPLMFDVNQWPAQSGLTNDAGQMVFRGKRRHGEAQGTFVFSPSPVYLKACALLRAKPSATDLFALAFYDVRAEELIGYAGSGLAVSATDLCALKVQGVKASYVKALRETGNFSLDDIKRLRAFGVPETYVSQLWESRCVTNSEELAQLYKYGLTAQEVMAWKWSGCGFDSYGMIRLHVRGVSPKFGALVTAIVGKPMVEDLIGLADFGISESYLGGMQKAGLTCSQEELTQLYSHGVDGDYYGAWHGAGYDFDPATIVRLHRGDVSSKLAQPLKGCGFKVSDFLKLQVRGVPADYVLEWRKAGFKLQADDFVRLYIAGVPASYAPGLKGAAVTPDDLLRLYQKGFSAQDIREINGAGDLQKPTEAGK